MILNYSPFDNNNSVVTLNYVCHTPVLVYKLNTYTVYKKYVYRTK